MANQFIEKFVEIEADLKRHCYHLANGSRWEAEDLFQETMIRAHLSMEQKPDREMNKFYLRRIATHLWIDDYRSNKHSPTIDYEEAIGRGKWDIHLTTYEVFEYLSQHLTAKQMMLVLLIDGFGFKAKETAILLHSTEGAVKEGLKRARHRLKELKTKETVRPIAYTQSPTVTPALFKALLEGFRTGNPETMCDAYLTLLKNGVGIKDIKQSQGVYYFTFRDPDGHLIKFSTEIFF
ncbi:hypothetical protein GCM10008967_13060 [Bacillus carboniphilus]|uniref:RNA polymerase n=1 Tax=Bacillus carboniphilus TaxID=86663 RepID=A0ABP3FRJ4_9BACI